MADRCNIHRGSGGRNRHNTDLFGISDTGVNRKVYPERNLPCVEHVSDIVDRRHGCSSSDRNSDRVGGINTDRFMRSSSSDMRTSGTDRRNNRRNHRNCLCNILHCFCGRRRRRRDSSSS